jgi:hypothetical protein
MDSKVEKMVRLMVGTAAKAVKAAMWDIHSSF